MLAREEALKDDSAVGVIQGLGSTAFSQEDHDPSCVLYAGNIILDPSIIGDQKIRDPVRVKVGSYHPSWLCLRTQGPIMP